MKANGPCNEGYIGLTLRDRQQGPWIRKETLVVDILAQVEEKKSTWAGHGMRITDNILTTSFDNGYTETRKTEILKKSFF